MGCQCVILGKSDRWKFVGGKVVQVPRTFVINDGEAMRMLIENGLGIRAKSLWNVSQSLRTGVLVEVLPEVELITDSSIWILYPSADVVSPKVRVMIDFLIEHFSPVAPWEQVYETREKSA